MKVCNKCHRVFNESEFYKDKRLKDRHRSECKVCRKTYNESHREEKRAYGLGLLKLLRHSMI